MKKQFLVLALGLFLSLSANAQRETKKHGSPEERAEMAALRMKHKLGLSEEQHKKVEALNKTKAKERAKKQETQRTERKAEADAYKAELKKILTPDQFAKFEANTEERRNKMKEKGAGPRGNHRRG